MSSWSKRRKTLYSSVIIIIVVFVFVLPIFYFFYKAPTCSDGIRNGNEQDVDCGGSCQRLCQSAFLPPSLAWTRFEQVAPSLYNLAAYIVNPNTEAEARNVPYHIALYDDRGVIITDTKGLITLPPHRNTIAFQGAINTGKRIPAKALFEFTNAPNWYKQTDRLSAIVVGEEKYTEDESGSSLVVNLKNTSVYPIGKISVYSVLYDKDRNALGFSKTIVDEILPQSNVVAPFTWPIYRHGEVISFEILPVTE